MQPAGRTSHRPTARAVEDRLHDRGVVDRRIGVRHADDRGAAAERRRARPGLDRLAVLATRFAEVHLDVDEPGRDDTTLGVEHRRARRRRQPGADLGDHPVDDPHVDQTVVAVASTTRRPWMSTSPSDNGPSGSEQRPQHGHADRDAVRDLFGDERARGVGDLARDLDPAVHRPGMHHERVGLAARRALDAESPARRVLAQRREQRLTDAFALDAQQVDDVDVGKHVVEVARHRDRPSVEPLGHERRRTDERQLAPECVERHHVAARNARVADVADDRDATAVERRTAMAAQRERVEQSLGGVLVAPVAGVDHAGRAPRRDAVRRAGRGVAHDDRVDTHRVDGLHRVEQALTLLHRRRGDREVHRVGREAPRRGLERQPGAGGVLVEEGDDRLAPQRRDLRDVALGHFEEGVGQVEHRLDAGPSAQVVDREQMPHPGRHRGRGRRRHRRRHRCGSSRSGTPQRSTPSSPSTSASRTRTSSLDRVGRFLPT